MLKKITFIILLLSAAAITKAQTIKVSGTIKADEAKTSVQNAVVVLLSPKDSVLKAFTRVKADGSFSFANIEPSKYILSVSHPIFGDYVDDIELSKAIEKIPTITLVPKSKLLTEVIIKSGSPIRIKGDTTVYTADSFKVSANANVEELLKKMPGIQVDKDGKIKAMGQTVDKVLVDGEEFFGDDPGMAVKNLRADAVKEVQVFDKKSDQAAFTGIDDGKSKKTINLKLKEDKKKGYFGKIDVAGGYLKDKDARWNDNLLLSSFKGKRKISAFLLNGNTGQDGLNWQDEQKYGVGDNDFTPFDEDGGINFNFQQRQAQDDEININTDNGFLTNLNAGLQYTNEWNEKTNLNFSPKYNSQQYNNSSSVYTQTQINKDTTLNSNSSSNQFVNRNNVRIKAIYEIKLDTSNSIKITGKSNFYKTESTDVSNSSTNGFNNLLLNTTSKTYTTNTNKQAYGLTANFKHKFKKARRTISLTADWNSLNSEGNNVLISTNTTYPIPLPLSIKLNQEKDFDKSVTNVNSKVVYTEPLNKDFALELSYQLSVNNGSNNLSTLNYDSTKLKYENKVDTLSNNFRQTILQNIPSFKINFAKKKFKANIGAGFSFINFDLRDISTNADANRSYTNFNPIANFTYSYKPNHSFSIIYKGTTKQPTIDQLQPLRKNDDYFNQYIGNPDLKPSFNNNVTVNHFGYDFAKDLWAYQGINFNVDNNSITDNKVTNVITGSTKTQPLNTNGNLNLNFYGGFGKKLKKLKTRVGLNINTGFNRSVNFVNNQKSISDNTSLGLNFNLNKEKSKKYDISIGYNPNYNNQNISLSNINTKYFSSQFEINATVYYKKVWSINTGYNLFSRQKTAQVPSLTNNILNAKLQRTFAKDEYTVYFLVKDIFKQNIGLDRSFYGNTFTETRNDRIQQYFMLGFAWNFKNKATK